MAELYAIALSSVENYKPILFSLSQTGYAISRACHCGCHFRILQQQSPTYTKVLRIINVLTITHVMSISLTWQSSYIWRYVEKAYVFF